MECSRPQVLAKHLLCCKVKKEKEQQENTHKARELLEQSANAACSVENSLEYLKDFIRQTVAEAMTNMMSLMEEKQNKFEEKMLKILEDRGVKQMKGRLGHTTINNTTIQQINNHVIINGIEKASFHHIQLDDVAAFVKEYDNSYVGIKHIFKKVFLNPSVPENMCIRLHSQRENRVQVYETKNKEWSLYHKNDVLRRITKILVSGLSLKFDDPDYQDGLTTPPYNISQSHIDKVWNHIDILFNDYGNGYKSHDIFDNHIWLSLIENSSK